MKTQQPEALDLADWLIGVGGGPSAQRAAALLRSQHARITELEAQLAQRFDAADMATAAEQGFRDGATAPAQPVAEPAKSAAYAALPEYGINTASHAHFRVLGFTADQMRAFADATCALRPSRGQAPAGANENAKLVTLIAECRDAFPIPANGDPIENYWGAAIEDPANAPAYLQEIAKRKQADSVLEDALDAAFEAVRKRLCGVQRYSFVLDDDGLVRRVLDRAGNWIEFDEAHTLLDPMAVDAARKQGATT